MAENALPPTGIHTLPQWWRQRCAQWADRPALRHKRLGIWTTMDWRRYFEEARALGLALDAAGLQPGEVVSILSHNRPEWLCMDLAAQAMGFVSHGLYPSGSEEEVAHALHEAGTRVLLVENAEQLMKAMKARGRCPALRRICVIDDRGLRGLDDPAVGTYAALVQEGMRPTDAALFETRIAAGTGAQIAALIGTAGTSAPARLAAVTQQALLHQVQALQASLGAQAGDHSLSFAPLAQADERLLATGIPLVAGGLVHFAESPGTVFNDLREAAPHWVSGPPRFWERLHARTDILAGDTRPAFQRLYRRSVAARRPGWIGRTALRRVRASLGLTRARLALVSAASLSEPLVHWYTALGVPLAEVYGLAESCGVVWLQTDGMPSAPHTEVRLAADGEILLKGPAVLAAYWSAGALQMHTAPVDGWFATGDLGTVQADGGLRIVGRRSERIEAAPGDTLVADELERLLRANAYVSDAMLVRARRAHCTCVLALEPERVFKYAQDHHVPYTDYAQLVAQPEIQQLIAQQLEALNAGLPPGRRIHRFAILPKLLHGHDEELTPQLRLRRRVIESKYAAMIDGLYA
ncbi:AMP-dependent synthetase/ligase [Variovorax sp. LT1R16]|uniref:AMP-dependent synthetase/ligase n=1 Tax=Variovorax sp. LT1R16 TaxID=3443728 RepID=UPI003F465448